MLRSAVPVLTSAVRSQLLMISGYIDLSVGDEFLNAVVFSRS